jgi:hypothetical protein
LQVTLHVECVVSRAQVELVEDRPATDSKAYYSSETVFEMVRVRGQCFFKLLLAQHRNPEAHGNRIKTVKNLP